jgi:hypothetical protein
MSSSTRRTFLGTAAASLGMTRVLAAGRESAATKEGDSVTARDFLADILYTKKEVDDWFAGRAFPFSKHDPELGWLLRDARFADGMDGAVSTYRYGPHDERITLTHADKPCRVNAYGDSYTQCHQVSDGETWEESLAAHLGEPVRNFGVGGWSVYQAYLRMKREEARLPADLLILNIYDDDHYRNLDAWRNIRVHKHPQHIESTLPHLHVNLGTGDCAEMPNPGPSQEAYYKLCDLDWVENRFEDDFVLNIMLAHANAKQGNPAAAYEEILDLATTHGIETRLDRSKTADALASDLFTETALRSSMHVVEQVEAFAREKGKKVLYVLSFNGGKIAERIKTGARFDQPFVDFLRERKLPVVDLMEAHVKDYANFSCDIKTYLKRYYVGHYNPRGNLFTTMALKGSVMDMLDPKPAPRQAPSWEKAD